MKSGFASMMPLKPTPISLRLALVLLNVSYANNAPAGIFDQYATPTIKEMRDRTRLAQAKRMD